jgi:hypothetical protein
MRIFAQYDSTGTIRALITVEAGEGAIAMPTPPPGVFVAEIDGLKLDGLKIRSGAPDLVEALRAIAKSHKVGKPLPSCTLTKSS